MLPWTLRRWLGLPVPDEEEPEVDPAAFERPPNEAFHGPLADAVRERPDDAEPYRVYADWLHANNDPRGELIRQMLDGQPADALLERHAPALLGPLQQLPGAQVTWRWGFWDAVTIRDSHGDGVQALLRQVLEHPSALVLRRLEVHTTRMEPVAELFADGPVLPLRELVVDSEGGLLGAWAAVWPRVPNLQRLCMTGVHPQLGAISLPQLAHLELRGPLDDGAIASLRSAHLPRLEQLVMPEPQRVAEVWQGRVRSTG